MADIFDLTADGIKKIVGKIAPSQKQKLKEAQGKLEQLKQLVKLRETEKEIKSKLKELEEVEK